LAQLDSPSTPLRIALITNNFTPYSGGVVSSISTLAQGLINKGHTVYIITLEFLDNHSDDPDYVVRLPSPIRFMYKNNHMAVPWRPALSLTQFLHKHAIDIVHTHHPFLLGIAGLRAARSCSLPTIFTYHTIYEEYIHYVPFFQHITKQAVKQMVSSYCNYVNHIIAPSSTIKRMLQVHHSTPISVIPSAIDSVFIHPHVPVKQMVKPIKLLCVSRFVHEKNLFPLFTLCKLLGAEYQLTFAGYGELEDALRAYTQTHLPKDKVFFVIRPTKQELAHLYKTHHLFLFTSTTDTQGLVLAEAMAAGTPVIALDGPGQRDIIKDGYNGFVCYSTQDIARHITHLTNNSALYANLQQGAHQTSKRYTINIFVADILKVYLKQDTFFD
jgi:1,2-diacylglycerol 3-alpha-glucosyltransferase